MARTRRQRSTARTATTTVRIVAEISAMGLRPVRENTIKSWRVPLLKRHWRRPPSRYKIDHLDPPTPARTRCVALPPESRPPIWQRKITRFRPSLADGLNLLGREPI